MSLLTLRRAMPMPRSWYERPRGARARCLCSGSQQHEASCACLSEKVPGDRMHQLLPLRGSVCDSAVGTARSWRRTFFSFWGQCRAVLCTATVAQVLWRPGRGAKQLESDSLCLWLWQLHFVRQGRACSKRSGGTAVCRAALFLALTSTSVTLRIVAAGVLLCKLSRFTSHPSYHSCSSHVPMSPRSRSIFKNRQKMRQRWRLLELDGRMYDRAADWRRRPEIEDGGQDKCPQPPAPLPCSSRFADVWPVGARIAGFLVSGPRMPRAGLGLLHSRSCEAPWMTPGRCVDDGLLAA